MKDNLVTISEKIFIPFSKLTTNLSQLKSLILSELELFKKKNCSKEYGYILSIEELISFSDNIICRNMPKVCFNIVFKAKTFKPKDRDEYEVKVNNVSQNGVLCELLSIIKVFIPKTNLDKWTYADNIFKYKKKTITEGDYINVIISDVIYEKGSFMCLARIK